MAIGLLPKETLYITVHLEDSLLYLGFADPDPPPKKIVHLTDPPFLVDWENMPTKGGTML